MGKIFNRRKYKYIGVARNPFDNQPYYFFQNILPNFSPEIVMVKEATLYYDDWGHTYFLEKDLPNLVTGKDRYDLLRVPSLLYFFQCLDENEREWSARETDSNCEPLDSIRNAVV